MNKAVILLLVLVTINFCSAECSENQIDINSASLSELQEITGIGPVYAQRIIDKRPYDSLDELTEVDGIAEKRLEDIKSQGLACVSSEDNKNYTKEYSEKNIEDDKEQERDLEKNSEKNSEEKYNSLEIKQLKKEIKELREELEKKNSYEKIDKNNSYNSPKTIKLSPKNIKRDKNKENLEKSDYAVYGFVAFSILITTLVFIRRNKIREELV
ncbi:MAG: ComEA family DNA-binding protein [Minisyncoccales bacterium]